VYYLERLDKSFGKECLTIDCYGVNITCFDMYIVADRREDLIFSLLLLLVCM